MINTVEVNPTVPVEGQAPPADYLKELHTKLQAHVMNFVRGMN